MNIRTALPLVVLFAALEAEIKRVEAKKAEAKPEQQPELSQEEVKVLALDFASHAADFPGTDHTSHPDVMQKASDILSFVGIEHFFDGKSLNVISAEQKAAEAEFARGPLPDWAIGFNEAHELVPGAQLCTRDGRRLGNAHALRSNPGFLMAPETWCVLTDAGNHIHMTAAEIDEAFTIGDYISDPQSVIDRFGR